jgi:hypothetical protein
VLSSVPRVHTYKLAETNLAGIKQYSKSTWKTFKVEFKEIEESIIDAKDEVAEELQLPSEQEAAIFRSLLIAEADESRAFRVTQVAEIKENQAYRSQQALALQRSDARLIQKISAKEGNSVNLNRSIAFRTQPYLTYTERKKIRLLRLVTDYDHTASLRRAQALRCAGTCSWLLQRSEFQEWIDETGPKHLWCYGIRKVLPNYIPVSLRQY